MTTEKAFEIIATLTEELMELKAKIKESETDNQFWWNMTNKYKKQVEDLNKNYIIIPIKIDGNIAEIPKPINM